MINRYGNEEGLKKWNDRCEKYKNSIKENLKSRRTGGFVSKESIRFFIPLYKYCRKLGIPRKDIYFGIKGSREFFIRDALLEHNGGGFYDFCIPNLKLIMEYHGVFWHPKNRIDWKNPHISYDDAY